MEEMRAKVKDVEACCDVILIAAMKAGILLDDVGITEERSVNRCSHKQHAASVNDRWRVIFRVCHSVKAVLRTRIESAGISSRTMDGATQMAVDFFNDFMAALQDDSAKSVCRPKQPEQLEDAGTGGA